MLISVRGARRHHKLSIAHINDSISNMISEFKSVFHSKLQMCANLCCCFCILKSSFCLIVNFIFCCNCLFHVYYTLGCSQWSLLYAELLLHCEDLIVCPSLHWPPYCSLHILGPSSAFLHLFLLCYFATGIYSLVWMLWGLVICTVCLDKYLYFVAGILNVPVYILMHTFLL